MLCFAEMKNSAGAVVARVEGNVTQEGDLTKMINDVISHFHSGNPGTSLMANIDEGERPFTIYWDRL